MPTPSPVSPRRLIFGAFADAHYADKSPTINRYYRHSHAKLQAAVDSWNATPGLSFVVNLGDLIDNDDGSVVQDLAFAKTAGELLASSKAPVHHLFGNHCIQILTKEEFAEAVNASAQAYSFDVDDWHFIMLDACFSADGKPYSRYNKFHWQDSVIPTAQLEWLAADLAKANRPTIVFTHQRLDDKAPKYGVRNAAEVRTILEASGRVRAVFQGHSHKNDYERINGIPYCVIRSMCTGSGLHNNGFATVTLAADSISVTGFSRQKSYAWRS